jgi:hypothetical protein
MTEQLSDEFRHLAFHQRRSRTEIGPTLTRQCDVTRRQDQRHRTRDENAIPGDEPCANLSELGPSWQDSATPTVSEHSISHDVCAGSHPVAVCVDAESHSHVHISAGQGLSSRA